MDIPGILTIIGIPNKNLIHNHLIPHMIRAVYIQFIVRLISLDVKVTGNESLFLAGKQLMCLNFLTGHLFFPSHFTGVRTNAEVNDHLCYLFFPFGTIPESTRKHEMLKQIQHKAQHRDRHTLSGRAGYDTKTMAVSNKSVIRSHV